MKRYLVFAYDVYYPSGGWNDFQGSFGTLEEAREKAQELKEQNDFVEIIDLEAETRVESIDKYKEPYEGKPYKRP